MKKNPENDINIIEGELISLIENLSNYIASQLQDYNNLINYMEQMSSEYNSFLSKVKLPKTYTDKDSKDNLGINSFFDYHCFLCGDFQAISEKIKTDIICKLQSFKLEFESDNKLIFFSLNSIIEEISSRKNKKMEKEFNDEFLSNLEENFKKVKTSFEENEKKEIFLYI